jgi:hypothetical protein
MEIVTGTLTPAQILGEVPEIAHLLLSNGVEEIVIEYGWGSNLPQDQLWNTIPLRTDDLSSFIDSSTRAGIFSPGSADLIIQDSLRTITFRLCHESDIHLVTEVPAILDSTISHWTKRGFSIYRSVETGKWARIA